MKLRGMTFADVAKEIRAKVGSVKETYSKAANGGKKDFGPYIEALWKGARPLAHGDPAMTYLQNRGLDIGVAPSQLRYHARVKFTPNGGGAANYHPAMLAQVVSPDASRRTVHITYLTEDGQKANVSPCRKMAPGAIPEGGAVRLAASAETMGIAEGIETALSASQLFGVPVWAATSAPIMLKWQPPKTVKHVLIFGDTDDSFTGQLAAYGLASHLLAKGFGVEVRLPDRAHGGAKGADWNDVLSNGGAS
jgi:putative DNA primase/helicase